VIVHFFPRVFTVAATPRWMGRMALAFALTTVGALAVLLAINFDIARNRVLIAQMFMISVVLAVPFTCCGVCVALALTRYPRRTNLLYGFDLAGAATGCLLFAPVMAVMGGPGLVLLVASIGGLGALTLTLGAHPGDAGQRRRLAMVASVCVLLGALAGWGPHLSVFQVRYLRGYKADPAALAWEGWNSISRVTVHPEIGQAVGVAPQFTDLALSEQQTMLIDTLAATPIVKFDGRSFADQYFAFHDISYAVHAIRQQASVAVIGVGGGRDVLAARAWGQPEIVGAEINSRILEALTGPFNDYAGRLPDWPGVTIVRDEARSYLARSGRRFDIIQASLIDTFAATSAGAFVLTENALYTIEGWLTFFDHLTNRGILTMTRWYTPGNPVESIRLLALARASLEAMGVARPMDHILMARLPDSDTPGQMPPATILVKKTAFNDEETAAFDTWTQTNGFISLVRPTGVFAPELRGVLEAENLADYARAYPFDISPPTDNRPFFFDVLRWRDILKRQYRLGNDYIFDINMKPLIMLGSLLATVIVMAFAFIVVPLALQGRLGERPVREVGRARRWGAMTYFIMLGLGYILIELTLMQRFTVFLGHPGYSLTVCLFTMLLASGLGSMAAPRIFGAAEWATATRRLSRLNVIVFIVLLLTLIAALWIMARFVAAPTALRIALAGLCIAPVAFLMGMPFPLAVQVAARRAGAPLSWYWGLNGAFSVCASVLTIALGHTIGLVGAFVFGACCYLIAAVAAYGFGPSAREAA
jgi:hypothetical protein